MNRLFNSSKFWLTVIGVAGALITYHFASGDNLTLAMYVGGSFTSAALGTAIEDYASKKKS